MYGAKYVGNLFGSAQPQVTKFQLTASETITKGDLVDLTSGLVNEATAAKAFLGIANETVTDSGSGTDYIDIIVARPGDVYLMDNDQDSDTFAVTDKGLYFDITGATGVMQIDTDTGSTTVAQLMCVDYNPQGYGYDSDTSIGLFTPIETMLNGQTTI